MSLTFAAEPLPDCWAEFIKLAEKHWNETEAFHDGQTFNPLFERYNKYAEAGWFVMIIARDEGRMVGYAGFYLTPSMHSQALISTEDTWYLLPEYRKGWNAPKLFKFAEEEAKRRGSIEASGTVRLTNPQAGAVLKRMGYREVARVFIKQLKDAA